MIWISVLFYFPVSLSSQPNNCYHQDY